MQNNEKMLPSTLPKSTEITRIYLKSTEICKIPSSREITQAKPNIRVSKPDIKQARSNITAAKANVRPINNGGGGGGGNGYRGPKGGSGGAANDPQYSRIIRETYQISDTKTEKEFLYGLAAIVLAIIAIQLLLGLVNSVISMLVHHTFDIFLLAVFVMGFFLIKNHRQILSAKSTQIMEQLKGAPVRVLISAHSKFKSLALNAWGKNKNIFFSLKKHKQQGHNKPMLQDRYSSSR